MIACDIVAYYVKQMELVIILKSIELLQRWLIDVVLVIHQFVSFGSGRWREFLMTGSLMWFNLDVHRGL